MPVISIRVSEEWLAMVDAEAGLRKWSRNAAIVNILWQVLGGDHGVVAGDGGSEGEGAAGGKGGRGTGRSSVPVLQKAKKPAKHMHPVHPVRDQLAPGGDGSPELSGKRPPSCTPGSCPHGKPHQAFCRAVGGGC